MIFALLTLFSAFAVAGVAGWFSIVGIMAIYAGAPYRAALVMGVVLEMAKLVTISWLYRNWDSSDWKIRLPLMYFIIALMVATSIGVFGFLTKSHLEQGAATIDNSAKVERLDQQILREKSVISDNEKVIGQLDAAINSYIGKDKTDRAVAVRKTQAPQRKQLRDDIDASQKKIDIYSDEKFKLQSEVRALELEVGPIRYIAELFYTTDSDNDKIALAVKLFTLLIVSTLDPLAIILLIAANHSIMRLQNEIKEKVKISTTSGGPRNEASSAGGHEESHQEANPGVISIQETLVNNGVPNDAFEEKDRVQQKNSTVHEEIYSEIISEIGKNEKEDMVPTKKKLSTILPFKPQPEEFQARRSSNEINNEIKSPLPLTHEKTEINKMATTSTDSQKTAGKNDATSNNDQVIVLPDIAPWAAQTGTLLGLTGISPHFIPLGLHEEKTIPSEEDQRIVNKSSEPNKTIHSVREKTLAVLHEESNRDDRQKNARPTVLGWINEFKKD